MSIIEKICSNSIVAQIIVSIAIMLFFGFLLTRLTKLLKLPNVTAYIIAGIIIGPYCINLIPNYIISGMDFLSDIALAFIAFSTGEFFKFSVLKKNGLKVIIITIFESLMATILVFITCFVILHLNLSFSIILGALAAATAPASTMMTIRQTKAKGDFVDTLLQVVALDDVVGLIAYSVAISIALSFNSNSLNIIDIIEPIFLNIGSLIIGGLFGLIMKLLIPQKRSKDNKLIISISLIFAFCGLCAIFDVSPLLGCMAMGTIYINSTNDEKLFKQLNYFSPPILLLFFVRSGVNFKLDSLFNGSSLVGSTPLIIIGIIYFFIRILGKYSGAYLGCLITKKDKKVRNYLGMALIPQAGVAIGLATLGARAIGGEAGIALETIILASSVLYELIGPVLAKLSLYLSKSYSKNETITINEKIKTEQEKIDDLIIRIKEIQKKIPNYYNEAAEEDAFLEAAEEYSINNGSYLMKDRR